MSIDTIKSVQYTHFMLTNLCSIYVYTSMSDHLKRMHGATPCRKSSTLLDEDWRSEHRLIIKAAFNCKVFWAVCGHLSVVVHQSGLEAIVAAAGAWSFLGVSITVHMLGCWWLMREWKEWFQPSQMLLILSPRVMVDSKTFHTAGGGDIF